VELACSESICLDDFGERCAAVTKCAEFFERRGAICFHADRFASAACAACYDTGSDIKRAQRC
jgi:hypothetical protein